jgi:hypothetical protein
MTERSRHCRWLGAVVALALVAMPAAAQTPQAPQPRPQPPRILAVQVNKAEIVRLEQEPSIVLVANPDIADVVVEANRIVFVVGKKPGETRLFVLDKDGNEIITREVVVVASGTRTVTVNRGAVEATFSCAPRCVQTGGPAPTATGGGSPATASTAGATPPAAPTTAAPGATSGTPQAGASATTTPAK